MFTAYDKNGKALLSATTFEICKAETMVQARMRIQSLAIGRWELNEDNRCFELRRSAGSVIPGELIAYIPGITAKKPYY